MFCQSDWRRNTVLYNGKWCRGWPVNYTGRAGHKPRSARYLTRGTSCANILLLRPDFESLPEGPPRETTTMSPICFFLLRFLPICCMSGSYSSHRGPGVPGASPPTFGVCSPGLLILRLVFWLAFHGTIFLMLTMLVNDHRRFYVAPHDPHFSLFFVI